MESGLPPNSLFFAHGIQVTFITPPEAGRKEGAFYVASKILEEKEQQKLHRKLLSSR